MCHMESILKISALFLIVDMASIPAEARVRRPRRRRDEYEYTADMGGVRG